jgi:hypothetical protein
MFAARRRVVRDRDVAENCASSPPSLSGGGLHAATPFAIATIVLIAAGIAGSAAVKDSFPSTGNVHTRPS